MAKPCASAGLVAGELRARGRIDRAIEAATALEQEAAVPFLRQRHREADCVGLAVAAGALVDGAVDPAVGWQRQPAGRGQPPPYSPQPVARCR